MKMILARSVCCAVLGILAACNGSSPSGSSSSGAVATALVALSSSSYSAAPSSNAVVTINRSGDSAGTATVSYTTVNGTATAGQDYVATSGNVTWSDGDTSPKFVTVSVMSVATGKNFAVALTSVVGQADFGTPTAATVAVTDASTTDPNTSSSSSGGSSGASSITSSGSSSGGKSSSSGSSSSGASSPNASSSALSIKVQGDHLVNGSGHSVQLRGASISGLENTAIQNWTNNPWGDADQGNEPNWSLLAGWHMNVVRLPLNETSWLGFTCTDPASGASQNPDPGGNYQATVKKSVADAVKAGLYVILDLHWSAPDKYCATGQTQMADASNSVAFWTSIANTFKDNPAVLFELFNEPFGQNLFPIAGSDWDILRNGGIYPTWQYQNSDGSLASLNMSWTAEGMQGLINAIRATGSTNVVLAGTMGWNGDLSQWLAKRPSDSAGQLAAAWHAYPWGSNPALPAWTGIGDQYSFADAILAHQIPLIITETGENLQLEQTLLPWADAAGVSYLLWAWDPWGSQWDLIQDAKATPTSFGAYYKAHLSCVASGGSNCP
jgi:endoglucanase